MSERKTELVSRRDVLGAAAGVATMTVGAKIARGQGSGERRRDIVVVGAGVFGAWAAWHLQQAGQRVLLLDAWGAAHGRASSGGESRMTRTSYGKDALYSRMAWESLPEWKRLSADAGLPIFHEHGVLFFFPKMEDYARRSIEVHRALNLPLEVLERKELSRRFPQIDFSDVELGLFEPNMGALMARRAVQTLVQQFVKAGGQYRVGQALPLKAEGLLHSITLTGGETIEAEHFIFACGPWLPKLFPGLLGNRIFPTRQELFFFAPPPGDTRFAPGQLPGWADFNGGDIYYGFPDLEGRGFKIAHDIHGPAYDPDTGDRMATAQGLADVRAYMARRFPAMADRPMTEARVCQYENSANGDFLIDRHPNAPNLWLVGGGSGHGFKHGPAVGRYVADAVLGRLKMPEPRFSLASKATRQNRAVH